MPYTAQRTQYFRESIIRNMSLVCQQYSALNLAQGLPEDDTPEILKAACVQAIEAGYNQYARTYGIPELGAALAEKMQRFQGFSFDPESWVTVCCGGTEAMMAAFLATLDPGDQVLVPTPYYENYRAELMMAGAEAIFVPMQMDAEMQFQLDWQALEQACGPRTRGLIINTPHNPTGKVFTQSELEQVAVFCEQHDLVLYTDETYEHLVYQGQHLSAASLPALRDRTITVSSMSKSYAATGWRVAWAIAPPELTLAIRKVHDFLTISAPHPMQHAAVVALQLPDRYYAELSQRYQQRRTLLCEGLAEIGLRFSWPQGAYYVLLDVSEWLKPQEALLDFAHRLTREAGVATVPGSAFLDPHEQAAWVRLAFCKQPDTLSQAVVALARWRDR